jgi:hypothetical protein
VAWHGETHPNFQMISNVVGFLIVCFYTDIALIEHGHVFVEEDHVYEVGNELIRGESALVEKWNVAVVVGIEKTKKHHKDEKVTPMEILRGGDGWEIVVDGAHLRKHIAQL